MKNIFLSILLCLIVSCDSIKRHNNEQKKIKVSFLKELITKSDSFNAQTYDTVIFNLKEIVNHQFENKEKRGLIYILNSDCSVCIAKYLDLISDLQETKETLSVFTIISPGSKESIKYYMQKYEFNKKINIIFFENIENKYVKCCLDDTNAMAFYIYKGKIVNSFTYE